MKNLRISCFASAFFIVVFPTFSVANQVKNDSGVSAATTQNLLLDVILNGEDRSEVGLFLANGNDLLVSGNDLMKWQVKLPSQKVTTYHAIDYYSLQNIKGATFKIDYTQMKVDLFIPADYFNETSVAINGNNYIKPDQPANGAYLNYDLNFRNYSHDNDANGLFTAGIFNKLGFGIGDFIVQYDNDNVYHDDNDFYYHSKNSSNFTRLNTYWQVDFPEKMDSLIVGDYFSTAGMWGKSADIGGLHFGTNFNTQPYFVTFPSPTFRGESVAPSTMDLYVNNALITSRSINPGPFDIPSIPVVTGQGDLKIVTTDLLGRQQTITVPYYASNSLLKQGLNDYAIETGFIRRNYGLDSNDYGRFAAVGNYRYGVTDKLTTEVRAEVIEKQQDLGVGANYLLGNFGVLSLAASGSNNAARFGGLFSVGFQHQTFSQLNFGFNTTLTSRDFTQLGVEEDQLAPSLINQVFIGRALAGGSSIALTYTQQNNRDLCHDDHHDDHDNISDNISLLSVSYSKSLWHDWFLGVTVQSGLNQDRGNAVYVTISKMVRPLTDLNISGSYVDNAYQGSVRLTKYLPVGTGYGYDLYVNQGQHNKNYQATVSAQNSIGTYSVGAAVDNENKAAYQLQASGSAVLIDGKPYLMRQTGDSFGLVQVPGYSNVGVYFDNQLVGKTDRNGNVFIPKLLPYVKNKIAIEPNDFPIDAIVSKTKFNAVPYYGSGEIIKFPAKPINGAIMKLRISANDEVPMGAKVVINSKNTDLFVADDGFVYLSGLENNNKIDVYWDDHQCSFNLPYKHNSNNPIPDLGEIKCQQLK